MAQARPVRVKRLAWRDPPVADIKLPGGTLKLTLGIGSALARRPGDPADRLWALGDRGANLKVEVAVRTYGLDHLKPLADLKGLKLLPRPDVGPTIAELRIGKDRMHLVRTLPLRDPVGRPISGRAPPAGSAAEMEPTYDLDGRALEPDPGGADTEGLAALADGTFWVSEEYGPSLIRIGADGTVIERWVPEGSAMTARAVGYPVRPVLPAITVRRRINRGFEAVAASPGRLHLAFQSALDRPDDDGVAPFARIWSLDADTGAVLAQHLYPFDPPASFRRDAKDGEVDARDLKICEIVALPPRRLLVLERMSRSARIYRVDLDEPAVADAHLHIATRPTLEEMSPAALAAAGVPRLTKTLIFSSDEADDIAADLEGMALVDDDQLILATDNDFGVEGAETRFYRLKFRDPLTD